MKVIVVLEAQFAVDVDTLDPSKAERAVRENWDNIYKHEAKWLDGTPPQLNGRVIAVLPQPFKR